MSQHPRRRTWRLGTLCRGRGGVRPEEGSMLLLAVLLFGDSSHVVQLAVSPQESVSVTVAGAGAGEPVVLVPGLLDRKSTRLNSSHRCISYAVFCLKKKKK